MTYQATRAPIAITTKAQIDYQNLVRGASVQTGQDFAAAVLADARQAFEESALENLVITPGKWHPIYATPADWYDPAQTGRATHQIRHQIASTQAATREAVDAIDAIQDTIRTLNAVSSTIAAAVEEQSAVMREMSGSMQTAAEDVSAISGGMTTIAQASGRADRAARQVRETARAFG